MACACRDMEVLRALAARLERDGICQSLRELAKDVNVKHANTVSLSLDCLEQRGFIARRKDVARGIRLLKPPADAA